MQAFVSEYAVNKDGAGNGTLLAALAEAGFLGLEKNRCAEDHNTFHLPHNVDNFVLFPKVLH